MTFVFSDYYNNVTGALLKFHHLIEIFTIEQTLIPLDIYLINKLVKIIKLTLNIYIYTLSFVGRKSYSFAN